jgi:hypothetical protein
VYTIILEESTPVKYAISAPTRLLNLLCSVELAEDEELSIELCPVSEELRYRVT